MHSRKMRLFCMILFLAFVLIGPAGNGQVQAKAKLSATKIRITKGNKRKLSVKGSKKKVKWYSKNKEIATVSKTGLVTAKKGGTTTIVAKVGKKKLKAKVYVKGINRNRVTMHKGLKYKLKVMNGTAGGWSSSDSSVAKVAYDGTVTAVSSGTVYVTCKSSGIRLKCEINVAKLNKTSLSLDQGKGDTLIRTGSKTSCSWSSSDNTVASVNKYGYVYGIAGGTAVITCKCGSATLKCSVAVKGNNIVTPKSWLSASKASRKTVTINGAYGPTEYTIYNQGSSINKSTVKARKKFMPYHGCAASATSTVLGGMLGFQVTPVNMIENVEKSVFGYTSWHNNYKKSYKNQLPLCMNGITKIFNYYGIKTKYVRYFSDSGAQAEIARHLKTGQPVIFVVSKKNRATGKSSSKWTNSYHTMAMLGVTDTGQIIVADSVNRSSFGSWQRIKLAGIKELIHYMFPCKKTKYTNYWGGATGSGGYVLVYTKAPGPEPEEETTTDETDTTADESTSGDSADTTEAAGTTDGTVGQ